MALSDCPKCWDTPCLCGYEYRLWSKKGRIDLAVVVLGINPSDIPFDKVPDVHPKRDIIDQPTKE